MIREKIQQMIDRPSLFDRLHNEDFSYCCDCMVDKKVIGGVTITFPKDGGVEMVFKEYNGNNDVERKIVLTIEEELLLEQAFLFCEVSFG